MTIDLDHLDRLFNEEDYDKTCDAFCMAWPELRDELKRLREEHSLLENQIIEMQNNRTEALLDAYERAAQACEEMAQNYPADVFPTSEAAAWARKVAGNCAAAIRALKEEAK